MTATALMDPTLQAGSSAPAQRFRRRSTPRDRVAAAPLSPRLQLVRAVLVLVFALSFTLMIQLVVVSSLQQSAAQGRAFDHFRAQLATGTAPIGPTDDAGRELAPGTAVAFIEIPSIGLKQVIGQGTSASVLFDGPGHRRDTPFPGQIGSSVVYGRRAAFGGPFDRIDELNRNAVITVTTGQGVFEFRVLGVRHEGEPAPAALEPGQARLQLVTAAGRAFLPDGVLRVDADMVGAAVVGSARLITASTLPSQERVMAGDTSTLWALALWLQALVALALASVWGWHRWGHAQAWVVFLPALVLVALSASGEVARLLPNLL